MNRAAFFVFVCIFSAGCGNAPSHAPAVIAAGVPRVTLLADISGEITSARDFVAVGPSVYLLDWRAKNIIAIGKRGRGWKVVRRFSRKGGGPGEILDPLALGYDSAAAVVSILERNGELESFDTAGQYVRSEKLQLPCVSARVEMRLIPNARLIGQRCFGGEFKELSPDTGYMIVSMLRPGGRSRLIASQPVSTLRGDWGSIYTANQPFAVAGDSLFFGSGTDTCVFRASLSSLRAVRTCNTALPRYSGKPPEEFSKHPSRMKATAWPDPLPTFVAITSVGGAAVMARIISADSVAFERVDAPGRFFLVAPLNTLVSCNQAGCLWFDDTVASGRIAFKTSAELAELMSSRTRSGN